MVPRFVGVAAFRSVGETCAFALVCALFLAAPAFGAGTDAGRVHFVQEAESGFDHYSRSDSRSIESFIRSRYARMKTFSPFFDSETRWYPRAWAYLDMYGIEPGSAVARQHPNWILRGRRGNKLWIPYDCTNTSCPRLAGDITNRGFRRWWIRRARAVAGRGYVGLYLDNVNMIRRVSLANSQEVTPYRARSRKRITRRAWRRHVARFTRQIRRSIPNIEIVHNVIWFAPRARDRWARMQVRSADIIGLERGVNDPGLTGDNGRWGLPTFLGYVDWLHSRGRKVFFDEDGVNEDSREYGVAGYLLINDGRDFFSSNPYSLPTSWWKGYQVSLGAPSGARYSWRGLIRRDFQRGVVLLNRPGRATQTVNLGGSWRGPDGRRRGSSVTLAPASGAVMVR
jgi:Hypothetical glycosyl hydrolase family 15